MVHFAAVWRDVFLVVAAAPLLYYVLATAAAWRFFVRERARKLPGFTPPVSVLKPVRGVDFASYENFASFCRQDYPEHEILFAVNDEADPAVPLIRRLMAEFPGRRIRLFVGAEPLGSNKKVNKLVRLTREAQNEMLVLTDGDVRVGPSYLREVVAPLADPEVGAVTSFYRAMVEPNFWAEMEAVGAASDFFAGVLMANWLEGVRFALGASIATTKPWMQRIGGLEPIASMHSDDYEVGNRIAKAGGKVQLSREAVWTTYPAQSWTGFRQHQLRWARTVRLSRPLSFAGLLFTHGLPWAIVGAIVAPTAAMALAYLGGYAMLRLMMAWVVGVWGVGDEVVRRKLWLVPLRDVVHFVIWLASFGSNRIRWGGAEFAMKKGDMVALSAGGASEEHATSPSARR